MSKIFIKGDQFYFLCPGCNQFHSVNKSWEFNGDVEKPTFSPSILVTNNVGLRCHSFVTNGKIQFLGDCVHELKGQTVELPDIDGLLT